MSRSGERLGRTPRSTRAERKKKEEKKENTTHRDPRDTPGANLPLLRQRLVVRPVHHTRRARVARHVLHAPAHRKRAPGRRQQRVRGLARRCVLRLLVRRERVRRAELRPLVRRLHSGKMRRRERQRAGRRRPEPKRRGMPVPVPQPQPKRGAGRRLLLLARVRLEHLYARDLLLLFALLE